MWAVHFVSAGAGGRHTALDLPLLRSKGLAVLVAAVSVATPIGAIIVSLAEVIGQRMIREFPASATLTWGSSRSSSSRGCRSRKKSSS